MYDVDPEDLVETAVWLTPDGSWVGYDPVRGYYWYQLSDNPPEGARWGAVVEGHPLQPANRAARQLEPL